MKTISSFKIHARAFVVSSCLLSLGCPALRAQNQTIAGDLNVTGSVDIGGPVFNLGTWSNNPARLGLNLTYAEDAGHAASLSLAATRPSVQWQWLRARSATDPASVPQMTLGSGNALTLYDVSLPAPHAAIVLDPVLGSRFNAGVIFYGEYNRMPNQLLDDPDCVITVGLADDRYVPRGTGNTLSLGYAANAEGTNSTALGAHSYAHGIESTALSYYAQATGNYSVALGNSSAATGVQSTALGAYSAATGDLSLTLGYSSIASGGYATAIGYGSRATGGVSTALGAYSNATAAFATTLGQNSTADATYASALGVYSYAHGDKSMALGFSSSATVNLASALGAYTTASNTGAVALGFGSTASGYFSTALGTYSSASGDYSTSGGPTVADSLFQFCVGANNVNGGSAHAWVPTDDLFTVGNGSDAQHRSNAFSVKKNGDATVAGTLTVAKALIIQPQGDLSMGEFTAQPSPAP